MSKEVYANSAVNNLSGGISGAATSVVLHNTAGFPTTGNFRLMVDTEIMLVTANNTGTNTLTVTRAQEGTTAAAHVDGALAYAPITDGSLRSLVIQSLNGVIQTTRRQLNFIPSGGLTLTFTDDAANDKVDIAISGSPPFEISLTAPNNGDFSWVNQGGTATVTSPSYGGLFLFDTTTQNSNSIRGREIATPATPYHVVARFRPWNFDAGAENCGFYWRDSASGKLQVLGFSGIQAGIFEFTNPTTFGATDKGYQNLCMGSFPNWVKIADDGTNRTFAFSNDGVTWDTFYSTPRTTFITPDHLGYFVNCNSANSHSAGMLLQSWQVVNGS